jgi:hypothetical protein
MFIAPYPPLPAVDPPEDHWQYRPNAVLEKEANASVHGSCLLCIQLPHDCGRYHDYPDHSDSSAVVSPAGGICIAHLAQPSTVARLSSLISDAIVEGSGGETVRLHPGLSSAIQVQPRVRCRMVGDWRPAQITSHNPSPLYTHPSRTTVL